jgi:hypothetical protein
MKNQDIALLVGGLEKGMGLLEEQMKSANDKLDKLPCATHTTEIKELKVWKQTCNGARANRNIESFKGMISLRNAIILVLSSSALSIIVTILCNYFLSGKP